MWKLAYFKLTHHKALLIHKSYPLQTNPIAVQADKH